MDLVRLTRDGLVDYTTRQLENFFPDGKPAERKVIAANMAETLGRLRTCINHVRAWPENVFDHLHSSQYCTYLYFLANTIWRNTDDRGLATRLFLLNKTLNSIDLFFEIEMPEVFFIGHSIGIVLAKATYGEHLVLYQHTTVGRNHDIYPVLGRGVVLYPNSSIIGRCQIGDGTLVSAGVTVLNRDTPGNCIAFAGPGQDLAFKPAGRGAQAEFFRA
jgi:serine O-acetyltransferase